MLSPLCVRLESVLPSPPYLQLSWWRLLQTGEHGRSAGMKYLGPESGFR